MTSIQVNSITSTDETSPPRRTPSPLSPPNDNPPSPPASPLPPSNPPSPPHHQHPASPQRSPTPRRSPSLERPRSPSVPRAPDVVVAVENVEQFSNGHKPARVPYYVDADREKQRIERLYGSNGRDRPNVVPYYRHFKPTVVRYGPQTHGTRHPYWRPSPSSRPMNPYNNQHMHYAHPSYPPHQILYNQPPPPYRSPYMQMPHRMAYQQQSRPPYPFRPQYGGPALGGQPFQFDPRGSHPPQQYYQ